MKKFEAGKQYRTHYGQGIYLLITVTRRTAKRVTFTIQGETGEHKKGIYEHDGSEYFYPDGVYSCAPVCKARNLHQEAPQPEEIQQENEKENDEREGRGVIGLDNQKFVTVKGERLPILYSIRSSREIHPEVLTERQRMIARQLITEQDANNFVFIDERFILSRRMEMYLKLRDELQAEAGRDRIEHEAAGPIYSAILSGYSEVSKQADYLHVLHHLVCVHQQEDKRKRLDEWHREREAGVLDLGPEMVIKKS